MYLLLTAVLCATLYFGVVWPLWLFATTRSRLYSIIVITAAILFLFYLLIRSFVRRYKAAGSSDNKRKFLFRQLFTFLMIAVLAAAVCFAVSLVLSERRLIALAVMTAGIAAAIILHKTKARFSDV